MRHSRARAGSFHAANPELRVGISLLSSLAIPLHRLRGVFGNAVGFSVHVPRTSPVPWQLPAQRPCRTTSLIRCRFAVLLRRGSIASRDGTAFRHLPAQRLCTSKAAVIRREVRCCPHPLVADPITGDAIRPPQMARGATSKAMEDTTAPQRRPTEEGTSRHRSSEIF